MLPTTNKALTIHRLALIERDPSSYGSQQILIEKKKILDVSVQEVVNKYQGFQGEDACFFEIDVTADEFKEKIEECLRIKELGVCFLLHVVSGPSSEAMSSLLKGQNPRIFRTKDLISDPKQPGKISGCPLNEKDADRKKAL